MTEIQEETIFDPTYQADLLSTLMTDKSRFIEARKFLNSESFDIPQIKWMYDLACHTMDKHGELPSAGLVAQEARSSWSESEFPTIIEVHKDMVSGRPSPKAIMSSAVKFAEAQRYMNTARQHDKLVELGKMQEARALMESQPWKISEQISARRINFGYDDFDRLTEAAKARRDSPDMFKMSTGIKALDDQMDGGYPLGDMLLLIGWTGRGKSTLAMNLGDSVLQQDSGLVYISSEMRDQLITTKFFARRSRVAQNTIFEYRFTTKEEEEYLKFMTGQREKMKKLLMVEHLGINHTTRDGIQRSIDKAMTELKNLKAVVLDSIDHTKPLAQFARDKTAGFAANANWFAGLMEEMNLAGIVTTQSNREGAKHTSTEHAANTIEAARAAQWVIAVNDADDSKSNPDPEDGIDEILQPARRFDHMNLLLDKARFGKRGNVEITTELGCSFMGDELIDRADTTFVRKRTPNADAV